MNLTFSTIAAMTPEQAAQRDAEVAAYEARQREAEILDRYKNSGAPERYWPERLETYSVKCEWQEKTACACKVFLRDIQSGKFKTLVLLGTPGTGKTHLACGLLREYGGKYRTAPDIVEEMRRAKSFTSRDTEKEIIDYYASVPLLAIDEIGRGISAADEKYMLYQILNARYNKRLPTILISNFGKADFLQYIGAAAADRLVESAELLELNGESYRRELRGAN